MISVYFETLILLKEVITSDKVTNQKYVDYDGAQDIFWPYEEIVDELLEKLVSHKSENHS